MGYFKKKREKEQPTKKIQLFSWKRGKPYNDTEVISDKLGVLSFFN